MKVLNLEIEGFRSLKHINWQPGDLTILIGPNGSGKSNLLWALEMLAVSAQGGLAKWIQSYGGMIPLVWDGQAETIRIKLECSARDVKGRPKEEAPEIFIYELSLDKIGKSGEYQIGREFLIKLWKRTELAGQPFNLLEREGAIVKITVPQQPSILLPQEDMPRTETTLSLVRPAIAPYPLLHQFRTHLAGWSVYHDFNTSPDAAIRQAVVTRHEKRVQQDGQNLISVLHTLYETDRDFKNEINTAMRAAFGEDFEELAFPPAADQRIQLGVRFRGLDRVRSATDLSDGTLRFLFLLTVLASPDPAPLIVIDEPETGLHPSMLPIIAEYAVDAARRTQVILTTHSPAFLDAFGKSPPSTTVVKWNEGQTELKTIAGDELHRWLEEYSLGALHKTGELEAMAS